MKGTNPPSIVTIAVLTTITIVFWIFFGVYRLTSEAAVSVPPEILIPIDPTLDRDALGKLEQRISFEKNEAVEFKKNLIQSSGVVQPAENTPTPTLSQETLEPPTTLEDTEEASPEANLEG